MTVSVGIMETAYEASLKESGVSASDLPGNLSFGAWLGQIGEELQTSLEGQTLENMYAIGSVLGVRSCMAADSWTQLHALQSGQRYGGQQHV